jgi:lipopolysaccharide export system permease protein
MHAGEGLSARDPLKFFTATDRYIFRLTLMPMLAVFVIAATLLVLDKMVKLIDFVSTEGGPVSVVFRLLANMLPEYASVAIPLGLMLGILLAFRKLSLSNELDIMRGLRQSHTRLLRAPYLITIGMMAVNLLIVGYLQPLSRYWYEQLQFELRSGALGASIKVGEFTTLKDRMALRIEKSQDEGRQLEGIFARVTDGKGQVLTISAKDGRFLALKDNPDTIVLRLNQGQIIQNSTSATPRVLSFSRHDLPISLPAIEKFRQRGGTEREFVLPQLLQIGWADNKAPADLKLKTRASFNYRIAEVAIMIFLPLLSISLAVPPKRSTSSLGVIMSVLMLVAYHKACEYGESIAGLGKADPLLIQWGPFVVFAALILWMYYRLAYVPGGRPIGGIERLAGWLGEMAKKLADRGKSPELA